MESASMEVAVKLLGLDPDGRARAGTKPDGPELAGLDAAVDRGRAQAK